MVKSAACGLLGLNCEIELKLLDGVGIQQGAYADSNESNRPRPGLGFLTKKTASYIEDLVRLVKRLRQGTTSSLSLEARISDFEGDCSSDSPGSRERGFYPTTQLQ